MRETLEKQSEVIINIKVRENAKSSREAFYSFPIRQPLINTMVSLKQKRKSWTGEHTPISFKDDNKAKAPRTKLENVKLREDLGRQNKKIEEIFELLQKQIQNLARSLDKQVIDICFFLI